MKRDGYMKYDDVIRLGLRPLVVWAYGRRGRYVGRVEINAAGLAAYTGKKGRRLLGNLSWERFFERMRADR